ncbi:MAG: hypothetical protein AB8B52_08245 [Winogradskyella sp.]|uniref:hypothetical protein n=1 Tax=Winogradskyella sp. TaxID=1883156 RepID=UPI00385A4E15
MKVYLCILVLGLTSIFQTVDAQNQVLKDSLSVVKIISIGEKASHEDYDVKFKKVITDSRCPKMVSCVRAGEADVLVSIYKNGQFVADKKVRIDASGFARDATNLAFSATDFKIYGFSLSPYPNGVAVIDQKSYKLQVVFRPNM